MSLLSLLQWIGVGIAAGVAISFFGPPGDSKHDMVCRSCGFVGRAPSMTRGSTAIDLVLWVCLIVPGLIYSIWRVSSRYYGCAKCGGKDVIPADSPIGRKIIADL